MRKLLSLVALLGLISTKVLAVYYPITQYASGSQTVNGNLITVTPVGPGNWPSSATSYCGVGPYYAGAYGAAQGWTYHFNTPVTHVRVTMVELHTADAILFSINGTPRPVAATDLTHYPGPCGMNNTFTVTGSGEVTSTSPGGLGAGAIVTLENTPNLINDFTVYNNSSNPNGVVYQIEFQIDSCSQTLKVTSNNPCANRELKLSATNFPGATFNWHGPQLWTATGPNVSRNPILLNQGGWYAVDVTWGSCTFKDSTEVIVATKPTPIPPNVSVKVGNNPTCKNMPLEVEAASTGAGGIQYYWYGGSLPGLLNSQSLVFPNIQPTDAGTYRVYAISQAGCVSDTTIYPINMLPDVTATMGVTYTYGCTQDTVKITNNSTGNNKTYIYFNPVNGGIPTTNLVDTLGNPLTIIYKPHVLTDTIPDTVDVKIVVGNGVCNDSMTQRIIFNHPVRAAFDVSGDTVCQHTLIDFFNKSSAATGPTHTYLWQFKTKFGDTAQTFDAQFTYHEQGVYLATLTVTDYLGCKDSAQRWMFIDSTGPISFTVSDSTVCAGDKINFSGVYERFGSVTQLWEFGDGNKVADTPITQHGFDIPGTYPVKFTTFNRVCPDATTTRDMVVHAYPLLDLGPDTSICPNGAPVLIRDLFNAANPLARYRWNTDVKRDTTSDLLVRHPGVYAASVEVDGCVTTDSIMVFKNCYVNIPNAFTPNGDGLDDYFLPRQILSKGVKNFSMTIFNRWGQKVFETSTIDGRGWDGMFNNEPQPLGVYIYQIAVTFKNNVSENYTGNVTLLR
ncbi:gliding motility-associated C-terminal domain-containing protein [Polluticoccus soli]|uniref:gliding motility-associated C-terminal domain-containing protein n=1 Tax=Polluticoccus soli TaxID=3034150 RepID=UPI0023E2558B|nr:gliding motility-associated C-terminal domain-containing protein [Flavipsychrobacter sp. JY13-12]